MTLSIEVQRQSGRNVSGRERPPREQPEHLGQDGSAKKQVRIGWTRKNREPTLQSMSCLFSLRGDKGVRNEANA
jgi:hypothetical protein